MGALHIFWLRGRAIGKGIYFQDIGIKNGINFQNFGTRNGTDLQDFAMKYKVGYTFSKIGISSGLLFQKIGIRNGYVFETSMAGPRPTSGQVHPPGPNVQSGGSQGAPLKSSENQTQCVLYPSSTSETHEASVASAKEQ